MVFAIEFHRTLASLKLRRDVPVPIILILRVHLMIINMKTDDMENKLLPCPGNLVQIEVAMRGRCLV